MRSIKHIIEDKDILICEELPEHEPVFKQLFNGFIAAVPHHPFIGGWINYMVGYSMIRLPLSINDVMYATGPIGFWRYYESVDHKPPLSNMCEIMPFTNRSVRSKICPPADYTVYTVWNEGSGWGNAPGTELNQWLAATVMIIIIILLGFVMYAIFNN